MAKLLSLIILVALSLIVEGINEVVFYQQPVCSGTRALNYNVWMSTVNFKIISSGHHYAIPLGRGECRRVPDWLSEEGWNLSLDPKGHCVQVMLILNMVELSSQILNFLSFLRSTKIQVVENPLPPSVIATACSILGRKLSNDAKVWWNWVLNPSDPSGWSLAFKLWNDISFMKSRLRIFNVQKFSLKHFLYLFMVSNSLYLTMLYKMMLIH